MNESVICENNLAQTQSSVGGEDDSGGAGGAPGTATEIGAGTTTATPGAAGAAGTGGGGNGGDATATAESGNTATATGGAGGAGGAGTGGGTGDITVANTGDNYEDVSSSAEVEQVAEQENEACQGSNCENNLAQTQSTGGGAAGGGGDGGDAIATSTDGSTTTATGGAGGAATGGAGGDGEITVANIGNNYEDVSSSAEVEQVAEQENEDCEGSGCENNLAQTQSTGGGAGGGANGGDATAIADDGRYCYCYWRCWRYRRWWR